jgi:AbiV family abortive infection protein
MKSRNHISKRLGKSVRAVIQNATRLLEDTQSLEFSEPPTSAWFLALIAQEELAKAFMLCLVNRGAIPWNPHILRVLQDHRCKQLVCLVMDYLAPDIDEFITRSNAVVIKKELPIMPQRIADALNILRHEKIGRWVSKTWVWAEEPDYDHDALAIAEGKKDRLKQDALYVRLGKDGSVASTPMNHGAAALANEMDRAERF